MVLDSVFDLYVLCQTFNTVGESSGYIAKVTLQNNIINVDGSWLVDELLDDPIDITYYPGVNQLYVISGITPNQRRVKLQFLVIK